MVGSFFSSSQSKVAVGVPDITSIYQRKKEVGKGRMGTLLGGGSFLLGYFLEISYSSSAYNLPYRT